MLNVACLRKALGDNLGSVLTPELAFTIEHLATDRSEAAIDVAALPVARYRNLTFQAESFRDILHELDPLHQAHYEETERHLAGIALTPNYEYMAQRERAGSMVQFTARDQDGQLVGNLRMYLGKSLHTGRRFAEEDTFYLVPAVRKGFAALSFLRYAEQCLVEVLGMREIRASTKTVNKAGALLDYRGYQHVANQYIKTF